MPKKGKAPYFVRKMREDKEKYVDNMVKLEESRAENAINPHFDIPNMQSPEVQKRITDEIRKSENRLKKYGYVPKGIALERFNPGKHKYLLSVDIGIITLSAMKLDVASGKVVAWAVRDLIAEKTLVYGGEYKEPKVFMGLQQAPELSGKTKKRKNGKSIVRKKVKYFDKEKGQWLEKTSNERTELEMIDDLLDWSCSARMTPEDRFVNGYGGYRFFACAKEDTFLLIERQMYRANSILQWALYSKYQDRCVMVAPISVKSHFEFPKVEGDTKSQSYSRNKRYAKELAQRSISNIMEKAKAYMPDKKADDVADAYINACYIRDKLIETGRVVLQGNSITGSQKKHSYEEHQEEYAKKRQKQKQQTKLKLVSERDAIQVLGVPNHGYQTIKVNNLVNNNDDHDDDDDDATEEFIDYD